MTLLLMGTVVRAFKSAAALLGSIKSDKKAASSRINGKKGGYWQQKRNKAKYPYGLNARYEGGDNLLNKQ